jgi:glycosyltransferase involved in cell wall biosynthesis
MKPYIIVQGPVATRSGYGNHTRDLVTSLIQSNKYDIGIVSLPWGVTPMDALKADNPEHLEIAKRILTKNVERQVDVFIQISVPNEFCIAPDGKSEMKPGKFNIGITAGIETTHVPANFIEGCNRMDLVITTSEHSKKGFIDSVFDRIDNKTNQKNGVLKLETPIEILFEGADLDVYKKTSEIHETVKTELSEIKDDFCYLFVGHWLRGHIGHDRKDIGMMIKTFCEAFKRKSKHNRPGLILKTSHAQFSIIDRDEMMRKIQQIIEPYGDNIPNIYLLHGDLSDDEMNSLYNHPKIKAMVSFTHGEGFGRPLLEFSLTGKPIIASDWSGQVDFLHKEYTTLLPGQVTQVHKSAIDQFIIKGAGWFTVNYAYAAKVLQDVMKNYKLYLNRSRKQAHYSRTEFSRDKMSEKFCEIVDKGLQKVPQQVGLKLPKLQKVGTDKKIKLPKLKKVEA